ncbi:hypothetical protein KM043_014711 [Ampulex compressa]|nr:hypothetical protein KM043_014711 [Ampulex compressa]
MLGGKSQAAYLAAKVAQTEAEVSARPARCRRYECSRGKWSIGGAYTGTSRMTVRNDEREDASVKPERDAAVRSARYPGYATLKFRRVVVSLAGFHPAPLR